MADADEMYAMFAEYDADVENPPPEAREQTMLERLRDMPTIATLRLADYIKTVTNRREYNV